MSEKPVRVRKHRRRRKKDVMVRYKDFEFPMRHTSRRGATAEKGVPLPPIVMARKLREREKLYERIAEMRKKKREKP